jgi:hypothetical protein
VGDLYSWVAGQTIHKDKDKLYFDDFEIVVADGGVRVVWKIKR